MPFLGARGQASRGYFGGGTTPDAPTSLVATRGDTEISVAFSAPVFNGGLDITNYEYSLNAGSTWTAISPVDAASPVIITGLSNGTAYTVYLRAVNAIGAGTTSGPANAVTPAGVPGAPGIPTATTCQNLQSALTWTAANNNGAAVTDYVVEYSTSATFASAVTVFADGTSASTTATVTGLTNGTTYYFRVKAANCAGDSSYSSISAGAVPAAVPGAPGTAVKTNGDTTDTFTWSQAASNGSTITAYRFQVTNDNGSTWYSNIGGTLNGYTEVAALSTALATQYRTDRWKVRASAVNGVGQGPYASELASEATIAWAFGGYTDSGTCASVACDCAACDCGTSTGTNTTRTGSRLCYRWTRSATSSTMGPLRNSDNSAACSGAYGSCTGGSCTSCTGCASYTSAPKTGTFTQGGIEYTYQGPAGTYYAFPNPNCSSGCDFGTAYYYITVCNGTNTITLTDAGLCYTVWGDPC